MNFCVQLGKYSITQAGIKMQVSPDYPISIIIMIVFVLGYIFFRALVTESAKGNIRRFLQESGATAINIQYEWPDLDRDTHSFAVSYQAPNGKQKSTRCKIHHFWIFLDNEIFWADPAELELLKRKPVDPQVDYMIHAKFKKKFPSYEIIKLLSILDSDDRIIMLKYTEDFQNILRCQPDGTVLWQAELPTPDDVYAKMIWKGNELVASCRSRVSVILDIETGAILSTQALK